MDHANEYRLLDCGNGRRLEAFGDLIVDRPAPMADQPRRAPGRWAGAIIYRAGRGWATAEGSRPERTVAQVAREGIVMNAQLGPGGQVGLFPEHFANAQWLRESVATRSNAASGGAPEILNLFGHTGLLSLVGAAAGARVTHVDASRPAVQAARRNADTSELATHPIRWIVDDAMAFVLREGRRGRRYAGFIVDPPSYGHAARGDDAGGWRFEAGIDDLLEACREVAGPNAFWVLTTHTQGWSADRLAATLERHVADGHEHAEPRQLEIMADSGAVLGLGAAARCDPLRRDPR